MQKAISPCGSLVLLLLLLLHPFAIVNSGDDAFSSRRRNLLLHERTLTATNVTEEERLQQLQQRQEVSAALLKHANAFWDKRGVRHPASSFAEKVRRAAVLVTVPPPLWHEQQHAEGAPNGHERESLTSLPR